MRNLQVLGVPGVPVVIQQWLKLGSMPNAIMIGYHGGGGGDPWQNFPGNQIVSLLSPPYWPTGTVDRTGAPNDRDTCQVG